MRSRRKLGTAERLREAVRGLRHLPDRILHSRRRRAIRETLQSRGVPRIALVVCHGNICRSPYAAEALRGLFRDTGGVQVDSAGFVGPGRPSPPDAIASAHDRGVDLSHHRSKLLQPRDVGSADLILVMDADQQRAICRRYSRDRDDVVVLGDLDPAPIDTRAILDPLGRPRDMFDASYRRIDRCLRELAGLLSGSVFAP